MNTNKRQRIIKKIFDVLTIINGLGFIAGIILLAIVGGATNIFSPVCLKLLIIAFAMMFASVIWLKFCKWVGYDYLKS